MLTGIHILLTYKCTFECDHCFLHCGPAVPGTFTLKQLRLLIDDAATIGTVEWIYFEGGEPNLYYPLLIEGVRLARDAGFKTGVVSNAYWATTVDDARLWLEPLVDLCVGDLSLSDDAFHQGDAANNTAKNAVTAARELGIPVGTICIEGPTVAESPESGPDKGAPIVGGNARFRGRAVDKLTGGLPRRPSGEFDSCPYEELEQPKRVHVDPYGNVHICQGLSMGSTWEKPLSELVRTYDATHHPICAPLLAGGPKELVKKYDIPHDDGYVDACHLCYEMRRSLMPRFPMVLAPPQVYGIATESPGKQPPSA